MTEHEILASLLKAMGCDEDPRVVTIKCEPCSKGRPRFSRSGRVYSDNKQKDNQTILGLHFNRVFCDPLTKEVAVACLFYRSSKVRIDVDNLLKQVLDSANSICWVDDMQVTGVAGILRMDKSNPRVVVAIAENHDSSISGAFGRDLETVRTRCMYCGLVFQRRVSHRYGRLCSLNCKKGYGVRKSTYMTKKS